ncbi:MAG: hypothetical protein ACREM1_15535 [Longimicrobiales bacterium]
MTASLWPVDREDLGLGELFAGTSGSNPHVEYQQRPLDWMVEKMGVPRHTIQWSHNPGYEAHEWDGTPDPLVRVLDALVEWQDAGLESGTTTGKTYAGALLVLWFLACFEDSLVVTVAPKKDQLQLHIWKEIGRLWPRFRRMFPAAELTTLRIRMRKGSDVWSAHGFVAGVRAEEIEGSATKAQGFHAEHMLIVFEETPGNHPAIMAAFENTCRAPHNLRVAFGNPDHQHDQLHQFCRSPGVVHVRASALDHPNVVCDDPSIVPGAVSAERIDRARQKNGEHSPRFRSRVRGISPDQSTEALIRRAWCEEAVARYSDLSLRAGEKALGVDVANSENGDHGAIAEGQGACCLGVRSFPCPDSNELGRTVLARMDADGILPRHVGVDSVGVGAGTVNELKWRGKYVRALNSGERAYQKADRERWRDAAGDAELPDAVIEEERYRCFRDQLWWQARIDLQAGRVALPNDPELIDDLTTVKFTTRGGMIIVEPKEKIRARLGRSTNKGDAFVYWNWVRPRQRRPKPDVPTWNEQMRQAELDAHCDTSVGRVDSQWRALYGKRGGGGLRPGPALITRRNNPWWR